jgi:hypothetical protein
MKEAGGFEGVGEKVWEKAELIFVLDSFLKQLLTEGSVVLQLSKNSGNNIFPSLVN